MIDVEVLGHQSHRPSSSHNPAMIRPRPRVVSPTLDPKLIVAATAIQMMPEYDRMRPILLMFLSHVS